MGTGQDSVNRSEMQCFIIEHAAKRIYQISIELWPLSDPKCAFLLNISRRN